MIDRKHERSHQDFEKSSFNEKDFVKNKIKMLRFVMQEAYFALLPFLIILAFAILLKQLSIWHPKLFLQPIPKFIEEIVILMQMAQPLLMAISFSYHLSDMVKTDRLTLVTLTVITISAEPILINLIFTEPQPANSTSFLTTPLIASFVYKFVRDLFHSNEKQANIPPRLEMALNDFFPLLVSFFTTIFAVWILDAALSSVLRATIAMGTELAGEATLFAVATLMTLVWFIGLHGTNMLAAILPGDFIFSNLQENLSRIDFLHSFVGFGGVGAVLALVLVIFIVKPTKNLRSIAAASLPFAICNISEPILYGLPLVLNFRLLIPFLAAPLVNMIISYTLIRLEVFEFREVFLPFVVPIGISGYLRTGSLSAAFYQFFLLALDMAIYAPFVLKLNQNEDQSLLRMQLAKRLKLTHSFIFQHNHSFQEMLESATQQKVKIKNAVHTILDNELMIYYQPKFRTHTLDIYGYEALLRLKAKTGKIESPFFLPDLEAAGFSLIIDDWVCQEVAKDIERFSSKGHTISINLHPTSIANSHFVDNLLNSFNGALVSFEIIERGAGDDPQALKQMERLSNAGLFIEIDDFGSGYANLSEIANLPVKCVKLDKSLIDTILTDRGAIVIARIAEMCRDLGYTVVAEGVETKEQFEAVRTLGVDIVQGWLFSKALPIEEALLMKKWNFSI